MIWILCIFSLFLISCEQKPQETHYKEVVVEAAQAIVPSVPAISPVPAQDPHAGLDMSAIGAAMGMTGTENSNMFSWVAPQGWKEEPGGGMRLATFHLLSDAKAIDCSIVSLGGMAGGLEANLRRWMGQIGVQATSDELSNLIATAPSTKIKTGQDGKIFDFTAIQTKSALTDKSMIVVMAVMDEATLFVKMTGTVDTVNKNKADFFKLVGSVEFHEPSGNIPAPSMNPSDPHAGLDMSAMGALISLPTSQNLLVWTSPDGWKEEPGTHMRMATFHTVADPKAIDCSIIGLAGPAGGLEANLTRWMGQLGLQPSDDHLKQLIVSAQDVKTKDGLVAKVFDFTNLQSQADPSDTSMIAAMITVDQTTVFVKMTGAIGPVKQNRENFLKLLGSIARK
jgi:hypothetical protein